MEFPNASRTVVIYEELLDRDLNWALREGSMHFEKASAVHNALRRIAERLEQLGIPYAIAGGTAMFFHATGGSPRTWTFWPRPTG